MDDTVASVELSAEAYSKVKNYLERCSNAFHALETTGFVDSKLVATTTVSGKEVDKFVLCFAPRCFEFLGIVTRTDLPFIDHCKQLSVNLPTQLNTLDEAIARGKTFRDLGADLAEVRTSRSGPARLRGVDLAVGNILIFDRIIIL